MTGYLSESVGAISWQLHDISWYKTWFCLKNYESTATKYYHDTVKDQINFEQHSSQVSRGAHFESTPFFYLHQPTPPCRIKMTTPLQNNSHYLLPLTLLLSETFDICMHKHKCFSSGQLPWSINILYKDIRRWLNSTKVIITCHRFDAAALIIYAEFGADLICWEPLIKTCH